MEEPDESGPRAFLSDLAAETLKSLRETPPGAKLILALGLAGFILCEILPAPKYTAIAALRLAFLCAFIAGAILNARYADEFYRRIYAMSCVIALPVCVLFAYALALFQPYLGPRVLGFMIVIWFLSFVIAFAAFRRP